MEPKVEAGGAKAAALRAPGLTIDHAQPLSIRKAVSPSVTRVPSSSYLYESRTHTPFFPTKQRTSGVRKLECPTEAHLSAPQLQPVISTELCPWAARL